MLTSDILISSGLNICADSNVVNSHSVTISLARQWRRNEFESGGHRSGSKVGGTDPAKGAGIFLVVSLHFFGSKSTISRFGERFRDGQYSLISFLFAVFLYSRCPSCPAIRKSGGRTRAPPFPMESAPL